MILIEAACRREGRSGASRDRALPASGVSFNHEQGFRPLTRPGYFLLLSPKVRLDSLRSKVTKEKGSPCKGTGHECDAVAGIFR